jgi:hypothetical protein
MSISSDGLATILHSKIYIGSANAVLGFKQLLDNIVLPLTRETTTASELRKLEIVEVVPEATNLAIELLTSGFNEDVIVILHAEVYLVDNFKEIDFELHYREDGAFYLNTHTEFLVLPTLYIAAERSPKTEKFDIVALDKTERTEIVEFFVGEGESAKVVNLCIDFLNHFVGKIHTLIAALEDILAVEVGMLVKHYLIHIELVEVGIKKRYDTRGEFHHNLLLPFLFSINIIS